MLQKTLYLSIILATISSSCYCVAVERGSELRKIQDDLLGAWSSETLPGQGTVNLWPSIKPWIGRLVAIGEPKVSLIDGVRYVTVNKKLAQGFSLGAFSKAIPAKGASIIAVARPVRCLGKTDWTSIVDVFYDRMTIGIRNTGHVCVRVNGTLQNSEIQLPDQRGTILSLVVQPEGNYMVYANGIGVISGKSEKEMNVLEPGVAGPFADSITIGRNAPDNWTAFNGDIGAIYIYTKAISMTERQKMERTLAKTFKIVDLTIVPPGTTPGEKNVEKKRHL